MAEEEHGIVTFVTVHKNLTFQIPGKKANAAGVGEIPSHNAVFIDGIFSTSDAREIKLIKEHDYFKRGLIKDKAVEDAKVLRVKTVNEIAAKILNADEKDYKEIMEFLSKKFPG